MIPLKSVSLHRKRVLIRADLNVAVTDGKITSDERIRAALDTIRHALQQRAAVIVVSHFGRPAPGEYDERHSLQPVTQALQDLLGRPVRFERDWIEGVEVQPGEVVVCENVRFLTGETQCSDGLSRQLAQLCDVFVMDAFGAAHRKHASTVGVTKHVPVACAGVLFEREIQTLNRILLTPQKPLVSIVGGAKIEGKLQVLLRLCEISDTLIVGGGIANTFLAAAGCPVGRSLHEPELIATAAQILEQAAKTGCDVPLPGDAVVGAKTDAPSAEDVYETPFFSPYTSCAEKPISEVGPDEMILDVGSATAKCYAAVLAQAGTIVWNGPVGAFEHAPFTAGTQALADAIVNAAAFTAAGGGDTVAALEKYGIKDQISYVSTGGGAFLKYVESRELPALTALNAFAREDTALAG